MYFSVDYKLCVELFRFTGDEYACIDVCVYVSSQVSHTLVLLSQTVCIHTTLDSCFFL